MKNMLEGNASFSYPFMELKQALRSWDLCLDEMIKVFDIISNGEDVCGVKKVSGSAKEYF